MITRIPQPQFIGPAPSEVVTQTGDNGTRLAQMFSTAMQEGTKNYLTQKQLDIEKQKAEASAQYNQEIAANRKSVEQDARDRAIREDFQKELDKAGPGAEWRVFIDNKPMAMKFFGTFAEDPEHAKSLYDAGLKTAMGHGSATSFFGAGAVGLGQQGTPPQGAQAAPTAPVSPTTTPAVPPGAPPLTPPSPPPMVQGANPQGSPTALAPSGMPPVPSGLSTPQPQQSVISKIAAAPMQPSEPGSISTSVTEITKGLPNNAATAAANSGLAKIAAYAAGQVGAATAITPKEAVAITAANKPNVQVMRDSTITKELLAENGPVAEEVLKRASDFLNNAIQDPTFLKWLQEGGASLTPDEAKSYGGVLSNDVKLQALLEKTVKDQALRDNAFLNTSLKAQADIDRFQLTYQALLDRAQRTKSAEDNNLVHMYQLANTAMHDYVTASDNLRSQFKRPDGSVDEDAFKDAYQDELARPTSPITQSLNLAVQDWAAASQIEKDNIPTVTTEFVDRYTAGIKLPFLAESTATSTTPYIPSPATTPQGVPAPQPGGAPAPKPAPPTAAGSLTPAQKARVMAGQPPGNPD